jgi:hypothetical protein
LPTISRRTGAIRGRAGGHIARLSLRAAQRAALRVQRLLLILVCFPLLDLLTYLVLEGESLAEWAQAESSWLATFAAGTLAYVVLRHLKKHTGLLRVTGR